jgi:hypothetical protein
MEQLIPIKEAAGARTIKSSIISLFFTRKSTA